MSPRRPGARATLKLWPALCCGLVIAALLGACRPQEEAAPVAPPIRPVRVVSVEELPGGENVTLTGNIQAQDEVNLAFRIGGQLVERRVNVGDRVRAGQVVARLDSSDARHTVDAARANLASAMARLTEARNTVARYEPLLPRGFVSRMQFDRAVEARQAAQAQVDAAQAQVATAENNLSYTNLVADGPGTVTRRGAEPGEVVAAGRMVVQLARQGGRDAVFDVPASVKDRADASDPVQVVLSSDPQVTATGRVREVSPQADPVTRTFQVRVGLASPPAAMRLGSTVTGTVHLAGTGGMALPAAALTRAEGQPAVWVLGPDLRVNLRNVEVVGYELDRVLIGQGLDVGELVVTAGVQTLRPGQQVRLLGQPAPKAQSESGPEPAAEPTPETTGQPTDQTATQADNKPAAEAEAQPATPPAAQSATQPATRPRTAR